MYWPDKSDAKRYSLLEPLSPGLMHDTAQRELAALSVLSGELRHSHMVYLWKSVG